MRNWTTFPATVMVFIGLLIYAGPYAMGATGDCLKDLDPEKDLGIKFDKVVTGSDGPPGPPEAEEIRSRALVGTLTFLNRTGKDVDLWVSNNSNITQSDHRVGLNGFNPGPFMFAVADPSGNTYLKACTSSKCYYKTLNDTLRYTYLWIIE